MHPGENAQRRLEDLARRGTDGALAGGRVGLEKESLRVTPAGTIAGTMHPPALGSALTHPHITTDYSEALIELITPPFSDVAETLEFLTALHAFVYDNIDDELLWATSMPCLVDGDESVPIAEYGSSNVGRMKHVYRLGLGHRYGRAMQAISGVHFNYSLPDAFWPEYEALAGNGRTRTELVSDAYFAMVRNFQRYGWLVPYLFGSSPAMCKSFLSESAEGFSEFAPGTLFQPYATSLRMSDIGYKNTVQSELDISYDSLERYVESLTRAIETPHPPYEKIGVRVGDEYRQLNANLLQIENEYYSFIRPKQVARTGEKPTLAMRRRGVKYVEVRALDVNPFSPVGASEPQLRFLEALLITCVLADSPPIDAAERAEIASNQSLVACCGRDPGLALHRGGGRVELAPWALEICEAMTGVCEVLDRRHPERPYSRSLQAQMESVRDPERTPSARILAAMGGRGEEFFHFAMRLSGEHKTRLARQTAGPVQRGHMEEEARHSLQRQARIEALDRVSFEQYLDRYFNRTPDDLVRLLA